MTYPRGRMGATAPNPSQVAPATALQPVTDPGMHYTYGVEELPLGAGAQAAVQFQVLNHDFEADFLVVVSDGAFTCQIQISGSRYLSNIPIHSGNQFGTAQNPMPLLVPLRLKKNDIVILTLKDLSGANNNVRIGFIGRELNT